MSHSLQFAPLLRPFACLHRNVCKMETNCPILQFSTINKSSEQIQLRHKKKENRINNFQSLLQRFVHKRGEDQEGKKTQNSSQSFSLFFCYADFLAHVLLSFDLIIAWGSTAHFPWCRFTRLLCITMLTSNDDKSSLANRENRFKRWKFIDVTMMKIHSPN